MLVTVAGIRGSAPREVGAKMIVSASDTFGTIGGGQLEYQCTRIACDMLGDDEISAARDVLTESANLCDRMDSMAPLKPWNDAGTANAATAPRARAISQGASRPDMQGFLRVRPRRI